MSDHWILHVPNKIKDHVNLSWHQKVLASYVISLTRNKGYCYATNAHLSEVMSCTTRTITKDIAILSRYKIIKTVLHKSDKGVMRSIIAGSKSGSSRVRNSSRLEDVSVLPDYSRGVEEFGSTLSVGDLPDSSRVSLSKDDLLMESEKKEEFLDSSLDQERGVCGKNPNNPSNDPDLLRRS